MKGGTEYPTQKPHALLARIIQASTNAGDLVLDAFCGSGTTIDVAQKLGRRWVACDINKGAIQTTTKRIQSLMASQVELATRKGIKDLFDVAPLPAQLCVCVYRVNDYDLQIQHNEAVNLACDYLGIDRGRADSFFDGVMGRELVKIVPFNHPLSPIDLDEVKKELDTRPDEDRGIVLVCLGMELAVQSWLDEWNRLRKGNAPNKIRVIELRTDPKYSGFMRHEPALARVDIERNGASVSVKIKDFISPTIVKRLGMEPDLFQKKITDWRSMVDCVMVDTAYDGNVFNVAMSDIPEKKGQFVSGEYALSLKGNGTAPVAVKIIDMLGEEVLVVEEV
jgi:SAM-dependent methyltransferase